LSTARSRAHAKERSKKLRRALVLSIVAIAASALLGLLVYSSLNPPKTANDNSGSQQQPVTAPQKIALVDQLSAEWPDPMFDQTAQTILNQTGLKVDYYPSEDVTVDFYRNLPSQNYRLIIFRVHSTGDTAAQGAPPWVVFFTSENYSKTAHVEEQMDARLVYVKFTDSPQMYFGITPVFVTQSMLGKFNHTMIIAMGCEGLKYDSMATAFIQKGARSFISWNGSVLENYTDNATLFLLRHLVTEKQTIEEAVNETMNQVGPDPTYKSILMFFPYHVGEDFLLTDATVTTPTVRTATEANRRMKKLRENIGRFGFETAWAKY